MTKNQTRNRLVHRTVLQTTEPPSPGSTVLYKCWVRYVLSGIILLPLNLSHQRRSSPASAHILVCTCLPWPWHWPCCPPGASPRNQGTPSLSAGPTKPYLDSEASHPEPETPSASSELQLQLELVKSTWQAILYSKQPLLKYDNFFVLITFVYFCFILLIGLWTFWRVIMDDWSIFPARRCTGPGPAGSVW